MTYIGQTQSEAKTCQGFVDMVSRSSLIDILEVALSARVRADYPNTGDLSPSDPTEVETKETINLRAYEHFSESSVEDHSHQSSN